MMGSTRRLLFALAVGGCTNEPGDARPRTNPNRETAEVQAQGQLDASPKEARAPSGSATLAAKPQIPAPVVEEPEPESSDPTPEPGPTFTVNARLVDTGRSVSHCGMFHFKVVMKFEVLEVLDGRFDSTTLYAGVSCPEMPPTRTRKFRWTVDRTYEIKLRSAGLRRTGTLVDAFEAEPGKRYELLHIEPTK